jgi:hypothetical protein
MTLQNIKPYQMGEVIEEYIQIISDDSNELWDFLDILREITTNLEMSLEEED